MKQKIILTMILMCSIHCISAQIVKTESKSTHMIGIKAAYNMSGAFMSDPTYTMKNINTFPNFSVSYTNYRPLWERIDLFGFQLSLSKMQQGYESELVYYSGASMQVDSTVNTIVKYNNYLLPFISQFHIDFWKMRLLLNAGGFAGYRTERSMVTNIHKQAIASRPESYYTVEESGFTTGDYRWDYGFTAGGGLAFVFKPFELHLETNYNYSFAYLHTPDKFDVNKSYLKYLFTHPHQLYFSLSLHFHL